jgi:hypothetical protein
MSGGAGWTSLRKSVVLPTEQTFSVSVVSALTIRYSVFRYTAEPLPRVRKKCPSHQPSNQPTNQPNNVKNYLFPSSRILPMIFRSGRKKIARQLGYTTAQQGQSADASDRASQKVLGGRSPGVT